jgi:hypothetical protein
MSNYIPHYSKKLRIRRKREVKLRKLIELGKEESKLLEAAELVRDARVRAQIAQLVEAGNVTLKAATATKLRSLRAATPESVLNEFRNR